MGEVVIREGCKGGEGAVRGTSGGCRGRGKVVI